MTTAVPFRIAIPQAKLDRILARVRDFDWEAMPDAGGWSAGIDKAFLRRVAERWAAGYDWRAREEALNQLPHFTATIDDQNLHFIHIRGSGGNTRPPVLLTHGWPGSFLEFLATAPRLAHPERFGGKPEDGLDLVIPSLPGYGFSTPLTSPIPPRRIAALFNRLMTEALGYKHYVAQGGDWGAMVSGWLAHDHGGSCVGLHLNMALLMAPGVVPETPEEQAYWDNRNAVLEPEGGYSHQQRTRPQTLGFALDDSPIGAAAWIVEKLAAWSDLPRTDGVPDVEAAYGLDHLIDCAMIYVATGTMTTSAWLYMASARAGRFALDHRVEVPTALAAFPDPVFSPPPRSFVEKSFNLVRWTEPPHGGHFAAMEQPEAFAADVCAFVKSLD